jgi:tRNA 2-thiouridine synthesizing protein A
VLCTDPGVLHDIPAWCRVHGHEVCNIEEQEHEITITIRVGHSG